MSFHAHAHSIIEIAHNIPPTYTKKAGTSPVAFSPDGRHIVSGSRDNTIRLWDAQTGVQAGSPLQGHTDSVNSVAFSPGDGGVPVVACSCKPAFLIIQLDHNVASCINHSYLTLTTITLLYSLRLFHTAALPYLLYCQPDYISSTYRMLHNFRSARQI